MPAFVAPALATTANTLVGLAGSSASSVGGERVAGEPPAVVAGTRDDAHVDHARRRSRPRSARCRPAAIFQPPWPALPRRSAACAGRRPAPRGCRPSRRDTNTPPASAGSPPGRRAIAAPGSRPRSRRRRRSSPRRSSTRQPTIRSKSTDAPSWGRRARTPSTTGGRSRSWRGRAPRSRCAAPPRQPMPSGVTVSPARRVELLDRSPSRRAAAGSRCGCARTPRSPATSASVSSVYRCIVVHRGDLPATRRAGPRAGPSDCRHVDASSRRAPGRTPPNAST